MGLRGHLASNDDWKSQSNTAITRNYVRPFIDTACFPEGYNPQKGESTWKPWLFWSYLSPNNRSLPSYSSVGASREEEYPGTTTPDPIGEEDWKQGQDVKWVWADPYGKSIPDPAAPSYSLKSFGMNNLNYGNPVYNAKFSGGTTSLFWHYRHMPEDGTYCVIDEFKISNKDRIMVKDKADNPEPDSADWTNDRVVREMFTSRYYLPPQPGTRNAPAVGGPPTFTSQTLLHSLKGVDLKRGGQNVAVVRVSWDVFTPRFMGEYKLADGSFKRVVQHTFLPSPWDKEAYFKGPFDYVKYNDDQYNDGQPMGETRDPGTQNQPNKYYSVSRPPPSAYQ